MATFVEVDSVEKGCKVIINLDDIIEIAPLAAGGCVLFFADSAAVNGKSAYAVKDSYEQFKQFAMQTVTAESISARFPTKKEAKEKTDKLEIPKF
jgi:hypothetical protein